MTQAKKENGLFAALAAAQAKLTAPGKNREVQVKLKNGGSYKFKYATLDHLIEHVRGPLTENGLWFVQLTEPGAMITRIVHESGDSLDSAVPMPNLPNSPQEAGSILSYFRRYSLAVALGLASDEDDDANVAEGNGYEARDRNAGGQSEERQVSPRQSTKGWREPDSIYSTPSKLHGAVTRMERELMGCGDSSMVYAVTATEEWKEFVRISELHMPHYLHGGEPAPEEFEGLINMAERLVKEFDEAKANEISDIATV